MTEERFYSRIPSWFLGLEACASGAVLIVTSMLAYRHARCDALGLLLVLSVVAAGIGCVFSIQAYRNRSRRPVITVSDASVEFGSIFEAGFARKRVAVREIVEVGEARLPALTLLTRSGKQLRVGLIEVRKDERAAVREAIVQRLAEASNG